MSDFTPWSPDGDTVVDDNTADGAEAAAHPLSASDLDIESDLVGEAVAAPAAGGEGDDPNPAVFIDSSAMVALVDRDDGSHDDAVAAYRQLVASSYRLFTTNYVLAETYDLLRTGVGHAVARQWLRDCDLAVYHADEQDERRARRMVLRAKGAQGLTMTDAISLVVMERLGVADAFAVDPNFLTGGE